MKKRRALLVSSLLLFIFTAKAQQDAHFSHYMFNHLYFNPGYSGVEGLTRATLLHRSQWLGYEGIDEGGAPTTQLLSVSHPLKMFGSYTVNSGVGIVATNDRLGPWRIFNLKLSYAYHIKLKNGGVLSPGLRIGVFQQGIDGGILRAVDASDDVVSELQAGGNNRQLKMDVDAGIFYNTKKYYAGITLTHLTASKFGFGGDAINSTLARHMYLTGGYHIILGQNLTITPNVFIETDFSETSFKYGALANLNNYKYWGGISTRQSIVNKKAGDSGKQLKNDDIIFLIGMSFLKNNSLRVGYAFDWVTHGASAKENTSHEIMLSYVVPYNKDSKYIPIKTPRYRKVN